MFYHDHRCSPQSARFCNNYYHPICDITATLQEYKPVARARPPSRTPPPISPSEKPDAWRATDAISPPSIYRLLMEINNRANSILTRSNKRTNERIQLGATRALSLSLSLSRHDRAQLRVDSGDTGKNQGDNSAGPGYNAIVKSRNRGFKHTWTHESMVLQSLVPLFALSAMMVIIIVVVVLLLVSRERVNRTKWT